MLVAFALLGVGAVLLYVGAEAAIRGSVALARAVGISAFTLGALLFGVDLEGLGTAVVAAGRGQTAVAAGEVFGTILFLYTAAFGVALLLAKKPVESPDPLMVVAPSIPLLAAAFVISDRLVDRLEAGLLIGLYAAYVALVLREGSLARGRGEHLAHEAEEAPRSRTALVLTTVGGLAFVTFGAWLLVSGGTTLLEATELSAGFVGAAVVGVLASLDEVLLEVLPVRRGAPQLATGNLFGTLAAFTSGVLGVAALVLALELDGASGLAFLGAAAVYALVATVFLLRGRAGRVLGASIVGLYVAWLLFAARV